MTDISQVCLDQATDGLTAVSDYFSQVLSNLSSSGEMDYSGIDGLDYSSLESFAFSQSLEGASAMVGSASEVAYELFGITRELDMCRKTKPQSYDDLEAELTGELDYRNSKNPSLIGAFKGIKTAGGLQ
jgi:hypothetical protein